LALGRRWRWLIIIVDIVHAHAVLVHFLESLFHPLHIIAELGKIVLWFTMAALKRHLLGRFSAPSLIPLI
jgi:hypothetical protein